VAVVVALKRGLPELVALAAEQMVWLAMELPQVPRQILAVGAAALALVAGL
jgi:hypothetical protein